LRWCAGSPLDGHEVYLVDPESVLPDPDPGDGGRVTVVDDLDSARSSARRA
jgi:glutaminase